MDARWTGTQSPTERQGCSRGVSEVISALLMVAVTIVLAAMVGSVLLNVVGDVDNTPLAGASVDFDEEDTEIRVLYTTTQQSGITIEVKVIDRTTDDEIGGSPKTVSEVGNARIFDATDGLSEGGSYTVRIVAKAPGGERAVVQEDEGNL